MKIEYTLQVQESPEVITDRVVRYYTAIGYKQQPHTDTLVFKRSSFIRGLFAISPKARKSAVEVRFLHNSIRQTDVLVRYNLGGQITTQEEANFWNTEIAAMSEATTYSFQPEDARITEKMAIREYWNNIGQTLLQTLLVGVPMLVTGNLVSRLFVRLLIGLLPVVGANGVGLISVSLVLALIAGIWISLLPLPHLIADLADRMYSLCPRWTVKPALCVIIGVFWGVFAGISFSATGIMKVLQSGSYIIFGIVGFVVMIVIGTVQERCMKSAKKSSNNPV